MTSSPPPAVPARRRQVHLVELTVMPGVRYSAVLGQLQAAAQADPGLAAAVCFRKHVHLQGGPAFERAAHAVSAELDDPLAVAFTVYFWNRARTLELARRIKERWPRCRIVVGGNDVTHQQKALFAEAPWVDVLVHGEGELRFADLLRQFVAHPDASLTDPGLLAGLAGVPGISHVGAGGGIVDTAAAPRVTDLDILPSPLLDPSVWSDDDLARSRMIVYETNRGCPYSCAFCYWGGATNSKVRQYSLDRIRAELERIVTHVGNGTQLFIADANFGILPRDTEIARHLVDLCARHGKRLLVMTNWAKNTNGRVVEIASILYRAGLTGAITLSAQSFDAEVLQIANRTNIRVDNYRRMQRQFREHGIPTYTDLIWGLPGESLATHLDGVEEAVASGGSPVVYPLLLLNNTDYTHARFRDEHALTTRRMPCDPGNTDLIADVVTGHAGMDFEDWLHGMRLRIPLTLFHKCLLRCTLRVLAHATGARTVDLVAALGEHLDTGDPDPIAAHWYADYTRAWREPDSFPRRALYAEIGDEIIHEEVHYQAILHRMVRRPERAEQHARAAVDFLYEHLGADPATASRRPERADLDRVVGLDLAAAAVFRAGIHRVAETHEFAIPAHMWAVLREHGDVPPTADESGDGAGDGSADAASVVRGTVTVPSARIHYPFSAYALSVWHGSGRPIHDCATIAHSTDALLAPTAR
ncbi:radical SAM protein [Streptomyces sp. SID3343]|uniref:radical SAM protein n=1 Tax=Streptomyces sp. SID3343 TaxID=2690260 RepID=UPI00136CF99E|nr:radical SAM protein [Streptomyces sp. SID3343]MYW05541.1 radical SAM protein [Streptomyces sp. SID3343]